MPGERLQCTVAGVDGCKAGWIVVTVSVGGHPTSDTGRVARDAGELLEITGDCACVVIDVPIGFLNVSEPGGREADRIARQLLSPRGSCVFPAPPRAVLAATSYPEAMRLSVEHSVHRKGLSKQGFAILPKIREVDAVMTPERQDRIVEGHPELSFLALNSGGLPEGTKHTAVGLAHRMRLLEAVGLSPVVKSAAENVGKGAKLDDVLDAVALAWTARRIVNGSAMRIPREPPIDGKGLRMEMWR